MAIDNATFGIQEQALQVQRRRLELIAANIANADTPGFQARDLDFRKVLESVQNAATPDVVDKTLGDAKPQYRVALQPAVDGNTVDVQVEQGQFADATLRYQASLSFLDGRIKSLMTALSGQ
ncbi:flagellar basal body rod protein FlgB [Solimonas terrae]|uniref:Flagellar basal body rod protein FlgB n=1 Tax=Solimonas terrae TaxID=1396819 RepID=A0A6M2BQQ6_9GAMM|nr:flagellar basal body rod protein FlgB [Solimonas terrae]NGY04403.1 flagellar basal body rod protein FlgB [Solimonas terrae]